MRHCLLVFVLACSGSGPKTTVPAPPATGGDPAPPPVVEPAKPVDPEPVAEVMTADTPKTSLAGNRFIVPAEWKVTVRPPATIITAPEGDSHVVIVDVEAKDGEAAVELAWAAYGKEKLKWPVLTKGPIAARDGWSQMGFIEYQTSPNEKRSVAAQYRFANNMWTVMITDFADATANKRGGQLGTLFGQFLPKGYERESFAGKKANPLDKARVAALAKFIEDAQKQLDVPGVALGLVQDGKVVFAGGFGVREKGKPAKVDGDTKFIVASNTKALTTLMLAKLVDEKKLTWDTPVTTLLPQFKLGDADTTSKVLVKHLICACTGMPRRDLEMIYEPAKTAEAVLAVLATMQPTSKFGELFQYSNPMAAAAGFTGGHVAFPKLELGKAYDEAMRTRVFAPLGMTSATFDWKRATTGNFSQAHADDIDGKTVVAGLKLDQAILPPVRPAGGLWVSVKDMLKYVQMELDQGVVNKKPYISKEALLARREKQVATGKDTYYGMGLSVIQRYAITVVDHGGDVSGFHSNMMWLPEHNVGAVIIVNSDAGAMIRSAFRRKLIEVLFDGKPEADAAIAANIANRATDIELNRKLLTIPPAAEEVAKLGTKYANESLGELTVTKSGTTVTFDFGEWKGDVATKKNPDGTQTFVTISPAIAGFELVPGTKDGKKTLVTRDAQHEYVFVEK